MFIKEIEEPKFQSKTIYQPLTYTQRFTTTNQ
jgi:hypothetical protein